jgi:hypothetical protein
MTSIIVKPLAGRNARRQAAHRAGPDLFRRFPCCRVLSGIVDLPALIAAAPCISVFD